METLMVEQPLLREYSSVPPERDDEHVIARPGEAIVNITAHRQRKESEGDFDLAWLAYDSYYAVVERG